MNYIIFYIDKSKKWIIINSINLLVALFCIFQLYGSINGKYFREELILIKENGAVGFLQDYTIENIDR